MSNQAKTPAPKRLTTPPKIRPLDPNRRLAPYRVPEIPVGKFKDTPGQMAMDFDSDDPGALMKPAGYIEP
jgi:hypothetical protein